MYVGSANACAVDNVPGLVGKMSGRLAKCLRGWQMPGRSAMCMRGWQCALAGRKNVCAVGQKCLGGRQNVWAAGNVPGRLAKCMYGRQCA